MGAKAHMECIFLQIWAQRRFLRYYVFRRKSVVAHGGQKLFRATFRLRAWRDRGGACLQDRNAQKTNATAEGIAFNNEKIF